MGPVKKKKASLPTTRLLEDLAASWRSENCFNPFLFHLQSIFRSLYSSHSPYPVLHQPFCPFPRLDQRSQAQGEPKEVVLQYRQYSRHFHGYVPLRFTSSATTFSRLLVVCHSLASLFVSSPQRKLIRTQSVSQMVFFIFSSFREESPIEKKFSPPA